MDESRRLRGLELRYALSIFLTQHGPCTVATLVDGLTAQGFDLGDWAPKTVSDALRWEVGRGRVVRIRRATYDATVWPRSTAHRIHRRVQALRTQARLLQPVGAEPDDDAEAFWAALGFAD